MDVSGINRIFVPISKNYTVTEIKKEMKKVLLSLALILLPLAICASEKIDGIYYNLDINNKTATIVFHLRYYYKGDLVIPSSVTHEGVDYSVTRIESNAFRKSSELTSITIPNSVTSIGVGIFEECTSLSSIYLEEGNPNYDSRENCNAIIETASNTLLFGCKSSSIPNSVTSIGNNAFNGCSELTSVTIPNSVTTIGESAFSGCSGLASVTIGNGVTTIGRDAFKECSNLTKVEINNNALISKAYNSNPRINDIFGSQVEEYILGEEVKSIGEFAFSECPNLTKVHLSNGLTSIGVFAFNWCSHLAEINIPSSVTSIERSSFYGCSSLSKVEINSNTLVNFGSSLLNYFGFANEFILGEEVTSIGNHAFAGTSAISINIPGGVTSIGDHAFYNCKKLSSINIPNNVASIGEKAFFGCTGLVSIQVESGNTVYDSREDCNALIKTADNTLLYGCQNTVIPNNVTNIGNSAFYQCTGITSISIPNSVIAIGDSAFYECSSLTSLVIPNSIKIIEDCIFCGCTGLTSVNIPNSVTSIGKYAFASCKSLTSVNIPNSVTTIGDYAFFFCTSLISITIPISVTSIGYRVFNGCSALNAIQVENGNSKYDSREDCNAIIETTSNTLLFGCQNTIIPNSVINIGRCAFTQCSGLTSISIPNSVTSIEYCAFTDCANLATVIIPNSVTNIGEGAFLRTGLADMYLYAEQMPELGGTIFDYSNYKATLHVPAVSLETYRQTEQWKDFKEIVALTDDDPKPTGIKNVKSNEITEKRYYSIDGKQTTIPQRGLNIIKMRNGTTKKVIM